MPWICMYKPLKKKRAPSLVQLAELRMAIMRCNSTGYDEQDEDPEMDLKRKRPGNSDNELEQAGSDNKSDNDGDSLNDL